MKQKIKQGLNQKIKSLKKEESVLMDVCNVFASHSHIYADAISRMETILKEKHELQQQLHKEEL